MNENLQELEEKGKEFAKEAWAWGHVHTFAAGLLIGLTVGVLFAAIFL
jgi:hypothetical protein